MFLKPSFAGALIVVGVAFAPPAVGQTSSPPPAKQLPAGTDLAPPPKNETPATQPTADRIARYHNLLKNEFMTDLDGQIILTSRAVQEAIRQACLKAAGERADVDRKIASGAHRGGIDCAVAVIPHPNA